MKTGTLTPLCAIYGDLPAAMAEVKVRENVWLSKLKILSLYKNIYFYFYACVCMWICYMCGVACRGQKRTLGPLELAWAGGWELSGVGAGPLRLLYLQVFSCWPVNGDYWSYCEVWLWLWVPQKGSLGEKCLGTLFGEWVSEYHYKGDCADRPLGLNATRKSW